MILVAVGAAWSPTCLHGNVVIGYCSVGLGGVSRVGDWIPVRLRIDNDETPREVQVEYRTSDPWTDTCVYRTTELLPLAPGSSREVTGWIRFGSLEPQLQIRVLEGETALAERMVIGDPLGQIVPSSHPVMVSLGRDPGLREAARAASALRGRSITMANLPRVADLPRHELMWDGATAVFLDTADSATLDEWQEDHWQALEDWLLAGGHVVVSLGEASATLLQEDATLSRLLRVAFVRRQYQKDTTGLESFAGVERRMDVKAREERRPWQGVAAVDVTPAGQRVLAYDGAGDHRTSWVTQHAVGWGMVTLVAVDWHDATLRDWPGRAALLGQTLAAVLQARSLVESDLPSRELTALGYSDLSGQLRMALEQFLSVRTIPFSVVAIAVALYIGLVGAGDYWLVQRLAGRPAITWITLPALVFMVCGAALLCTWWWKGDHLRANQLHVADIDPDNGRAVVRSWWHGYSPRAERFDLGLQLVDAHWPTHRRDLRVCGWEGLPGKGFGGMDMAGGPRFFSHAYLSEYSSGDDHAHVRLAGFPLPAWSSRGVQGVMALRDGVWPTSTLTADALNHVIGSVQNPLPVTLRDCGLCFDRWYYPLGTLGPGSRVPLTANSQSLDLRSWLTRRRFVEAKEITSPWDPTSTDLGRIAWLMMFYDAAGGKGYAGLEHEYHRELDASDLLTLDQAVLIGRATKSLVAWDSQPHTAADRQVTLVRMLIPVQRTSPRTEP